MFLVDAILKPADTYWKKQYNAEKIRRMKAEADAKCYKDEADYTNESLALLSDRDLKQSRAIDAYTRQVAELEQKLKERDREITMIREVLAAERRASRVYAMTEKLFETVAKKEATQ